MPKSTRKELVLTIVALVQRIVDADNDGASKGELAIARHQAYLNTKKFIEDNNLQGDYELPDNL